MSAISLGISNNASQCAWQPWKTAWCLETASPSSQLPHLGSLWLSIALSLSLQLSICGITPSLQFSFFSSFTLPALIFFLINTLFDTAPPSTYSFYSFPILEHMTTNMFLTLFHKKSLPHSRLLAPYSFLSATPSCKIVWWPLWGAERVTYVNVQCGSYMHARLHSVVLYLVLRVQAVIYCICSAVHNPAVRRASLFCSIMKEDDQ